jgi:hypothetical protein
MSEVHPRAPRRDLILRAAEDWERQRIWHRVFGGPAFGYVDHAARSAAVWERQVPRPPRSTAGMRRL